MYLQIQALIQYLFINYSITQIKIKKKIFIRRNIVQAQLIAEPDIVIINIINWKSAG